MIEVDIDIERTVNSLRPDQRPRQHMIWLRSVEHNMVLPMVIGTTEAMSIYAELTGEQPPRPLTHDLVRTILDHFDTRVEGVYIVDLRDGIFYAELQLSSKGKELRLDARPSDSIAMALRYDAPIYMAEAIMVEAGYKEQRGVGEMLEQEFGEWAPPEVDAEEAASLAVEDLLGEDEQDEPGVLARDNLKARIEQLKKRMEQASKQERYEEASRLRDEIVKLMNRRDVQ